MAMDIRAITSPDSKSNNAGSDSPVHLEDEGSGGPETGSLAMRRVVVTGMGIVSSIGNDLNEVTASLREAKSGISFSQDFADNGFRCRV